MTTVMEPVRPKMDSNVKQTKMQRMIHKAMTGDRHALKYLQLGTEYITYQKSTPLTWAILMADYKLAATSFVTARQLECETLIRLSKRLLHYIKFNSKGFNSEVDREAARVYIQEQLKSMAVIAADLPLVRMRDRSDRDDIETSSEDLRYEDYSDDEEEEADPSPKVNPQTKTVSTENEETSQDEECDEASTSRGKRLQQEEKG